MWPLDQHQSVKLIWILSKLQSQKSELHSSVRQPSILFLWSPWNSLDWIISLIQATALLHMDVSYLLESFDTKLDLWIGYWEETRVYDERYGKPKINWLEKRERRERERRILEKRIVWLSKLGFDFQYYIFLLFHIFQNNNPHPTPTPPNRHILWYLYVSSYFYRN